ncbi:MAG: LysR substrate-binding domain-containing protein [Pseudodesulfovibrio sp.]
MHTRQLEYFLAVAEELHFRKAAERLHMTQPPLSQQIASLEDELGVALFVRDRRKVELTEAGRSLLSDARAILSALETARQRAVDIGSGRGGRLAVGFVGPAIDGPLPDDIRRFGEAHPGVVLDLHEATTRQQLERLKNGTLDAGVVRLVGHDAAGLTCVPYHRERYVLAVPEDDPLAGRKSVPLSALDGRPLILAPRNLNTALFDAWAAAFAEAGARMNVTQEAVTKHTSVALVAAGHGVSPVPESTAATGRRGVAFVGLRGGLPPLTLHLAYREPVRSAALERFMDTLLMKNSGKP